MDLYGTWTEERLALLKANYGTHSMRETATMINEATGSNFTKNAIIGKLHRMEGYQPPKNTNYQPRKRFISRTLSESHKLQREALDIFIGIPFIELKQNDCRFPRGEDEGMLFCGQPIERGSYCSKCYHLTHMAVV